MISDFIARHTSLQSALPILFDAAIKGTFLVAVAAAAAYLLRKRSAASRHAVWTAAVIGHLAIPALVFLLPAWTAPVLPTPSWVQVAGATNAATTESTPAKTAAADATLRSPAQQTTATQTAAPTGSEAVGSPNAGSANRVENAKPVSLNKTSINPLKAMSAIQLLAAMWFVGALLVLLRLAIGTWRVGQLAREGQRVEDGVWLSLTQRLANRLGVTRPLILLRGEKLAVPVTWGIVYPAVLLPQDADQWSEERRRFVLVHEMAHVKRFDALTQLLAQLSVAIFWFDPLVWLAAHRMRVEREHACDDYVLRDGTTPSLYAGELLEMVRSIGTPSHDSAAPAFAALAMARRSEFEGRMLAILDPRLDRHTLNPRSTIMTFIVVALLTFPLAAWRPFQQPQAVADDLPKSFKISISEPITAASATNAADVAGAASGSNSGKVASVVLSGAAAAKPAALASKASQASQTKWTCEAYPIGTELYGTSTHVDAHDDGSDHSIRYLVSERGRCTEAQIIGRAVFSSDERHLAQLAPGAFARFRERTSTADRIVSITPVGDGSLNYAAVLNGKSIPFDAEMQTWLSGILPEILREAPINASERVARIRDQSGVSGVLKMIAQIRSTGAKRAHYDALLEGAPLSAADAEKVATQAPKDLGGSSGDLSAIIQKLPRTVMQSAAARNALADALPRIQSSGDRVNTLELLAPNADPEMLIMLAKSAETLPSSGDKANFLVSTAAEYLSGPDQALHNAYFRAVATIPSSGDMANVLITAMPYGHANPDITSKVIEASKGLRSSGDAANVLVSLVSQRLLQPSTRATIAVIERTLTMDSSGDRANVLVSIASHDLLATREVKDRYLQAAAALPSDGDRVNVLAAAARR
jgi:beta-lactamase regulating signal transducer with metallopeptidase domain